MKEIERTGAFTPIVKDFRKQTNQLYFLTLLLLYDI